VTASEHNKLASVLMLLSRTPDIGGLTRFPDALILLKQSIDRGDLPPIAAT
jgi:hypothetical protein